ncbi:MAG: Na+/H+ antiporter subunit G [Candidatus Hydrothermae bacterium]|nr:Na+/H+ antiporter subunit G [Candidatus Hydrothermae bacterium]RKZ02005.1 MAG: cation:proton antiporter [Candidatus Hydrothermae bacterium]
MWNVIVGEILLVIGAIFLFLGSLGIFRLPDVYNRLQAGTKCTTLGAFSTVLGVGFIEPHWMVKSLLVGVFLLLTNPVSAHAIGRASYRIGVKLWKGSVVDKLGEYREGKNA